MPRRFPTLIDLTDYTAEEIAQIAQKFSLQKFNLAWEVGVEEQLALHILQHYADDIPAQNGGLAVNIVETAVVSSRTPERWGWGVVFTGADCAGSFCHSNSERSRC